MSEILNNFGLYLPLLEIGDSNIIEVLDKILEFKYIRNGYDNFDLYNLLWIYMNIFIINI